jgi:malto-oligosyltrehalose synthase/4-alpha-glucanotransferase
MNNVDPTRHTHGAGDVMYNPVSTLRLQFHKEFTFDDFEKLIPFFSSLGISTIYASPIFHAVEGSNHGYDVVNPHVINPEIGTIEQFERIIQQLRQHGIGWMQDIVPNHMAFHPSNTMLMDVLEHGPDSKYAGFFDTGFATDFFHSRLMLPVLDGSVESEISKGKLKIVGGEKLFFEYGGNRWPLNERSKELLRNKTDMNSDAGLLLEIASIQYYTFCDWRQTDHSINYRRFFTVNSLICLNMQSEEVFRAYHSLIRTFTRNKLVDGLRVDHIDGLFDPETYLSRLRDLAGPAVPIIIEKILEPGEKLQPGWPIQGTSGYDFLATLNNIFTWTKSERQFNKFYNGIINNVKSFEARIHEKKSMILFQSMAGELENLTQYFLRLQLGPDDASLKDTIASFLIHCPWYRFYGNKFPLNKTEQQMVLDVLDEVRHDKSLQTKYALLVEPLIEKPDDGNDDYNARVTTFYQRLMQFSGPLMAKGVEDTLMYTFNRFIGHNEVGDSAEEFGTSTRSFHAAMVERQKHWPLALSATSTHDTKRGEDVRMRLNILTDLSDEWIDLAGRWLSLDIDSQQARLDKGERYFIYQTLIGCFPMDGNTSSLLPRVDDYFIKAFREAKRHTGWNDPDNTFEAPVNSYVHALLKDRRFLDGFLPFEEKVKDFGIVNSLSQLVLKMTCPGVPDIYQASINWDLNLVDPDNRRPVDYQALQNSIKVDADLDSLWEQRYNGDIKVHLTQKLLHLRKANANLFATGIYIPLEVTGKYKENILTFARRYQDVCIVVIVPLHLACVADSGNNIHSINWSETFIELPMGIPSKWINELDLAKGTQDGKICLADVFEKFPIAVLRFQRQTTSRRAGILLPITSLPSSMPVGGFGPAAREFADFLMRSGQQVWQMLPLNATDETVGFSPYSSYSSIAGNPLLISIEDLVGENLLDPGDIPKMPAKPGALANFQAAHKIKGRLLNKAWERFKTRQPISMSDDFERFISEEGSWLNDFALFEWIFRDHQKPWFEWPVSLRDREPKAIESIEANQHDELRKIKWIQFIFFRQVKSLRQHCNMRGISLMGDLPFYISHNSADVWVNRDLFEIDNEGSMTGVAGVPPDYFNDDGQLWGMPVYNWSRMKEEGYEWWTFRIKKNMEIYDSLRLDHFRAFSKFWKVPKGETTAVNGAWMDGPGLGLFHAIKNKVGNAAFVAEDLGDVDEDVFRLRDELSLPGMKVLQFAFGGDYPESIHLPHHHSASFVVYTGTHDNNTTRGWFANEISDRERMNLGKYAGASIKKASHQLIRMAYASVAETSIIPMQDILDLPGSARINKPSAVTGNWIWRMRSLPDQKIEDFLNDLRSDYDR